MHLTDKNLAWMHKFGVTDMEFDSEGNVLKIKVLPWVTKVVDGVATTDPLLAIPEAPIPPQPKELTPEELRIALAKARRQSLHDTERSLYAAVGAPPWSDTPEQPDGI